MRGLNLDKLVSPLISRVVPRRNIAIYFYMGQENIKGVITPKYSEPIFSNAQVSLANSQELQHIQGINLTEVYKKFYIQGDSITGLNRNIQTGGDYVVMDNLKYKIISVTDKFKTGWTSFIGVESRNE